jgi:phytoene desaturase
MIYEKIEEKFDIPNFKEIIEIERFFLPDDFINKYNSFSGTALGPLHDLRQTLFRPKNKSKNIKNLYYVGSYVNPGIGMPMVIASAMVTYNKIIKDLMIK